MGSREITIEHPSGSYTGRPGTISGTSLSYSEETGLVALLEVTGGDWKVRLDGVQLGALDEDENGMPRSPGHGLALAHLARLLTTVGVPSWEQLVSAPVFVLNDQEGRGVGIAHLTDDSRVMLFELHAAPWVAMLQQQAEAEKAEPQEPAETVEEDAWYDTYDTDPEITYPVASGPGIIDGEIVEEDAQ